MPLNLPGTRGTDPERARKWTLFYSYAPDWILTIVVWGLMYLLDKIDGYRRLFDVTDTSLAHPYAVRERIPVWLLAVICGVVPAIFMILIAAFIRRSFWDAHSAILGFVLNLGLSVTITNIIKITVGRPRPDLFSRCQIPDDITTNPIHGLTSYTVCQRTDLLMDGFRSFPSGHSSFGWAGMWYLILYCAAKARINNRRGYTWKSWLLLAPLMCAFLVSISRTMDYRHHATDVIAGGIIGIATAWFSYRQYYPPIAAAQSYKPYSPRIPRPDSLPLHQKKTDRPSSENLVPSQYITNTTGTNTTHGASTGTRLGYPPISTAITTPSATQPQTKPHDEFSYYVPGTVPQSGGGGGKEESVRVHSGQREDEERRGLRSEEVETMPR